MDIDEQILAALQLLFQVALIDSYPGDRLQLTTLKQSPLQDDPTIVAPYVTYGPNNSEDAAIRLPTREEERMYGGVEIGGPMKYLHFYQVEFGTPQSLSREEVRQDGATLMSRIVQTLAAYNDLSGILGPPGTMLTSSDSSKYIEGSNNRLVTQAGYHEYGGEQTFYAKGMVLFQYPVSWNIPQRTYTFS